MHLVSALQLVREECNAESFNVVLSSPEFEELANLYEQYCKDENDGPLKMFWNSYLEMVATLLSLIRATREGNWELHLECIKAVLPWFFAYDHTNYVRYLPVYLVHMLEPPDTHPEAYSMLSQGDFGVQRTTSHGFSQLPVDQTIEQTLNRNTKTKGGIIGLSLKKGAVQWWMLTAYARASSADRCREMASLHPQDEIKGHKESGSVRKRKDEEDVKKVMEVISQWRNPFETADDLVSLSPGSIASSALKEDLLKAEEKRKSALVSFVQHRLISSAVGFFETLPKLKLGKFGEVKKTVNQGRKSFVLRADRNLFFQAPSHRTESTDRPEGSPHSRTRTCALVSGNLRWLTGEQQLCPRQWEKFLANGLNKTNLMEFLADVWGTDQRFARRIGERTLFVTHGESCF